MFAKKNIKKSHHYSLLKDNLSQVKVCRRNVHTGCDGWWWMVLMVLVVVAVVGWLVDIYPINMSVFLLDLIKRRITNLTVI